MQRLKSPMATTISRPPISPAIGRERRLTTTNTASTTAVYDSARTATGTAGALRTRVRQAWPRSRVHHRRRAAPAAATTSATFTQTRSGDAT